MNQDDRLEIIQELRMVSEAFIIENGMELVDLLIARGDKISEYYRGDDGMGSPEQIGENQTLESLGIKPIYFRYTERISSTKLRGKLCQ